MTVAEITAAIDEQIAKAEATLREVLWTAEGLRSTLIEMKCQKAMLLTLARRIDQEAMTR